MKILIVGAGGVGGIFGAKLAADGNEVVFAVRGRQREAMARNGLKLLSETGDIHIEEPELLDDPVDVGRVDAAFLCTKLWDLEAAAALAEPMLAHDAAVVPFQNGIAAEEIVAGVVGRARTVGGIAYVAADIQEPGVIRHTGPGVAITLGELDGSSSWRLDALEACCTAAGLKCRLSRDITQDLWKKFVMLTAMAGATALYRCTLGEVLSDPARADFHAGLVRECAAVGRIKGVALADDLEYKIIAAARGFPPAAKSSMLVDLEHGRRLELDWLNGTVVRLGQEFGVATPSHAEVCDALQEFALGA